MKRAIKYKKIIMLFVIICVIILARIDLTYANPVANFKEVKYSISGPISGNTYSYDICLDALKYHINASSYDAKIGELTHDNFSEVGVEPSSNLKAKGYGYYLYKLASLKSFIEFCHSQNSDFTENSAIIMGATDNDSCDYAKLLNLSASTLSNSSRPFVSQFWNRMYADQSLFESYQDSYFFKENTLKAIQKIKGALASEGLDANNLSEKNLSKSHSNFGEQSKKEYLTLLTTYMYSINREEKLASVGKGDLVPFLYYAEHTDETDPYIIAKYAYVALVYEFLKVAGNNYWSQEFESLYFGTDGYVDSEIFKDNDIETLEAWYDETYEKYKNDRGVKQNPLIGSDIDTIIGSNYTINYQVEATKDYVESIYAEIGIDMTVDDFIARNALMAEYMMQNSNFDDVIKDYNVSIKFTKDNLRRGTFEEKNGTTAVLSDFQMIEFNDTIEKVANEDKDEDGITNKVELGNTKWQDITGFVEKTYIDKYGTNMYYYETIVDELVLNNGGYTDFNGNFVNGHVKKEKDLLGNIKVFYRVYDYKSNPVLKDTDFDGMNDNADSRPKDNKFHGTAKIERNQNLKVDYHNDYRHFYIDNNKYNSELAEMSLIISNLANDENRKLHIYQGGDSRVISTAGRQLIGDMTITQYLSKIGFIPLGNIPLYDGDGKCYLYYKIINYYGEEKLVFGIFIGGFNNERAYRELVVNNDGDKCQSIINAITNQVKALKGLSAIKQYFESSKYCYWITGKNISGAIATGVATKIEDAHNTYCYTYGVPNVKGTSTLTYIKNIVNEDDLLQKIHNGIGQEGDIYNKSIYWDLIPEYKYYVENPNKYKGNFKRTNNVRDSIKNVKDKLDGDNTLVEFNNGLTSYLYNLLEEREGTVSEETISNNDNIREEVSELIRYKDEVSSGNSTKAYWCLVKSLDGYDSKYYYTRDNNEVYNKKEEKAPSSDENKSDNEEIDILEAIKEVGVWYVNHVITYKNERRTPRGTTKADNYYNENVGSGHYVVGEDGVRLTNKDTETAIKSIGDKIGYYYAPFTKYYTSDNEIYQINGTNRNYLKRYLGGDCSGFTQGVVYTLSNGDRGQESDNPNIESDTTGLWNHNVSSDKLVTGSSDTDNAMLRLGWTKYYLDGDVWKQKRLFNNEVQIRILQDAMGDPNYEMSINFLEPGDLVCSNGHAEFYVGYNYRLTYNIGNNGKRDKKNGIESISIGDKAQRGYSTFGWGNVQYEFPKQTYRFTYESDKTFRWRQGSSGGDEKYKVIWRKN